MTIESKGREQDLFKLVKAKEILNLTLTT